MLTVECIMESSTVLLCLASVLLAQTFLVNAAAKPRTSADNQHTDFTVTLPPECIGQDFCTIKPIDYPTALMDQEAKLLVKRSRRQTPQEPPLQQPRSDGSNCEESVRQIRPYVVVANNTQHVVVQSGIFSQVFNGITCRSNGASCFESLSGHGHQSLFYCGTRLSLIYLTTYNFKLQKPESFEATIPVGCACSFREDE